MKVVFDRHHIIPTSRQGTDNPKNVLLVEQRLHRLYHHLFENRTPIEAMSYLVENPSLQNRFDYRILFGDVPVKEAIEILLERWTRLPRGKKCS